MKKYKGFKIPMLGLPHHGRRKNKNGEWVSINFHLGGTTVINGTDESILFYSWFKAIDYYRGIV